MGEDKGGGKIFALPFIPSHFVGGEIKDRISRTAGGEDYRGISHFMGGDNREMESRKAGEEGVSKVPTSWEGTLWMKSHAKQWTLLLTLRINPSLALSICIIVHSEDKNFCNILSLNS